LFLCRSYRSSSHAVLPLLLQQQQHGLLKLNSGFLDCGCLARCSQPVVGV
jgi:hypothetical protein